MHTLRKALVLITVSAIFPITAHADLVQNIIVTEASENGDVFETYDGGLRFGTLIFPNEFQQPFGSNPTCSFRADILPLCETGQFIADRETFPGFNDLNGTGVPIPDVLDFSGTWSIDERWRVEGIFAWAQFDLGDINDGFNQLTLVFGSVGNICANFDPEVMISQCFGAPNSTLFTYELTPAHAVPEPGTLALLGMGLFGVVATRRRKSRL